MKIKISLALLFISLSTFGATNVELLNGWKELAKNNFSEVESHFRKAAEDPAAAPDAYLSLSIYHMSIHKNAEAYADFKKFLACSKNPDPAIFAFENTNVLQDLTNDQKIAFYEQIVQMPSISETIKSMAYERAVPLYEEKGETSKMQNAGIKIGSINEWQLLGSFENLSGSGFWEDHGAIAHPETSYKFKDKNGADISWFTLSPLRIRSDKWIDLNYNFYISNTIAYAQTFVTVPADVECQLRLGTSGSYKIWINDHLIMSDEEERNNDLDTYISTIKLYKGTNRVLLQIGASEISSLNFLCRITDNNGLALTNAKYASATVPYNKEYDYNGKLIPIFAEEFYQEKVKSSPELLLNYFMLAQSLLRNDKAFEALLVLKDAEVTAPNCIYLLMLKVEQATRAKNSPGYSSLHKQMKEAVPDNYSVMQYDYSEMVDGENYDRAEEILDSIKMKYGVTELELERQIGIYAQTKRIDKMLEAIDDAYKKYPDYYPFVQLKFIVETQIRKDNSAGEKYMTKFLSKHHRVSVMNDLNEHYLKNNNAEASLNILEKMVEMEPYAVGYLSKLARLNYLVRDFKKSHEYNDICHTLAPSVGSYYELDGDLLDAEKKPKEAMKAYTTCIAYSPTNYDARMKLRKLEKKPDIFDAFHKVDFKELYKSSPSADKFPEDNSVILIDATQNVVYRGGASIHKNYLMVKVFNASGIDNWKEYSIGYYSGQRLNVDEAFVIKKNGTKVDADRNDNQIVFTNLEVNDAICLSYKVENYYTGKLAQHLNDIHYFNYYYPMVNSSYELMIDTTVKLQYKISNSDMKPVIKNMEECKFYSWTENNKPAIVDEDEMPELTDIAPTLRISTFTSWDDVSKWYSSISNSKSKPGYEVKKLIKDLFPENEKLTDLQKARRIYDYVVKEIRYSSVDFRQSGLIPQSTANTLNSRIGDCKDVSNLFVAMCREVGLDAKLTLVCTNDNGSNFLFMPTVDFNHCIAVLNLSGKKYYIELTSDCMPFGSYNGVLVNAQALEIDPKGKNDIFRLPPSLLIRNSVVRNTVITLEGEKITVSKKNIKTGSKAAEIRYTFRDLGKEQQEKTMGQSVADELPSVILEKVHFDENLNGTSDTVSYEFKYSSDGAISDVGGIKAMKLPFSDGINSMNMLSVDKRMYPISTDGDWFTMQWDETIKLTLPPTSSLLKVPEAKVYSSEFGDYSLTFTPIGKGYTITRKLKMKSNDKILPEKYPAFKSFMQKVIKADGTQLAIK